MNSRLAWVDLAKLVGIFLMVLCHGVVPAVFDDMVHAFHMPLFFVLSGYCFSAKRHPNFGEFIKSRTRSLLIPYIFWSVVIFTGWEIFYFFTAPDSMISLKQFCYYFFYDNASYSPFCAVQWFLTCMFLAQVAGWLVLRMTKERVFPTLLLTLFLGILGWLIGFFPVRLPLALDVAISAAAFFLAGWLIARIPKQSLIFHPLALLVFWGLGGVLSYGNGSVNMRLIRFHHPLFFYIAAVLLSVGAMGVCYHLAKGKIPKLFLWLGQNTLPVLVLNQVFIQALKLIFSTRNQWIWFLLSVGVMGMMIPCIGLLNKFAPFSVGKIVKKQKM